MYLCGTIWIRIGCFFAGMLLGVLILAGAVKTARSQMEEFEEEENDSDS